MRHTHMRRAVSVLLSLLLAIALIGTNVMALAEPMAANFSMTLSDGSQITLCGYLDDAQMLAKLTAAMTAGDTTLSAQMAFAGTVLSATIDGMLPGFYGIDLAKLAENLPASIFAPNSGSQFALDQQTYDSILNGYTSGYEAGLAAAQQAQDPAAAEQAAAALPAEAQALIQEYTDLITGTLTPGMTMNSETFTDEYGSEYTTIVITVDHAALSSCLKAVAEKFAADPAMQELVYSYAAQSAAQQGQELPTSEEMVQEIVSGLTSSADGISQDSVDLVVTMTTDNATQMPVYADICLQNAEQSMGVEAGYTSTDLFLNVYASQGEEYSLLFNVVLSLTADDSSFSALLTVISNDSVVGSVSVIINTDGTWSAGLNMQDTLYTAEGTWAVGENDMTITLTKYNDQPMDAVLTLAPCEAEEAPAYTEILTLSEADFSQLAQLFSALTGIAAA